MSAPGPNTIYTGDCLEVMRTWPDGCVDCIVTSPPYYGLRNYGVEGQIGLERSIEEYIAKLVAVFREARRVLKPTGTLWCNLGDSYATGGTVPHDKGAAADDNPNCPAGWKAATRGQGPMRLSGVSGLKPKDLLLMPARVALALQADGWWLRSDIIWAKPNPMPESCKDRPTSAHEHVFLLTRSARYFYDAAAIAEPISGEQSGLALSFERETKEVLAPGQSAKQHRLGRSCGDRKVFRGGGAYTSGNAFDNDAAKPEGGERFHGAYNKRPGATNERNGRDDPENTTLLRNSRNVWTIPTFGYSAAHFATFPPELARRCILAGCPPGGVVLDPFFGSGTTGEVAAQLGRQWLGIELNEEYCQLARIRTAQQGLAFGESK